MKEEEMLHKKTHEVDRHRKREVDADAEVA
jgi:hypothetical protein